MRDFSSCLGWKLKVKICGVLVCESHSTAAKGKTKILRFSFYNLSLLVIITDLKRASEHG